MLLQLINDGFTNSSKFNNHGWLTLKSDDTLIEQLMASVANGEYLEASHIGAQLYARQQVLS